MCAHIDCLMLWKRSGDWLLSWFTSMEDLTPAVAVVRSVIRCFYAQSEMLGLFSFIQTEPFVSITSCTESATASMGFKITLAVLSRLTNSLHFCLFLCTVLVCCF